MNLTPWRRPEERVAPTPSTLELFALADAYNQMGLYGYEQAPSLASKQEEIGDYFKGFVQGAYKRNGVIFACVAVRMRMFSEIRFQFRQIRNGRPGDLFGTEDLQILEQPWPGGTTGDMMARAEQDASFAGNFFIVRRPGPMLKRLRPDWVTIVLSGDQGDPDSEVAGYLYHPGGKYSGEDPYVFDVGEVAHYMPNPDPEAHFRGMSWLTSIIREIQADKAATEHKLKFFENGATPSMIGKLDIGKRAEFIEWVRTFREQNEGVRNAYKTLWLAAGADVTPVGVDFKQLEFKVTQGAGETRIAAAAEVPPVIVGLSEGLQAATYSNYALAMRRFTDLTMRPLWRNMAACLQTVVNVPPGAELWYDDRDVPALSEDSDKQAQIDSVKAATIHTLISAGYEPDSVVSTIAPEWVALQHSGLYSVQLQPAGSVTEGKGALVAGTVVPAGSQNGSGAEPVPTP